MRWPRPIARVLAALRGYFYLPCPICGTRYAGFEWEPGHAWYSASDGQSGHGYCWKHPADLVLLDGELYLESDGHRVIEWTPMDPKGGAVDVGETTVAWTGDPSPFAAVGIRGTWKPNPGATPTGLHLR